MDYYTQRKLSINEQSKEIRSYAGRKRFLIMRFKLENNYCEICRCDFKDKRDMHLDHDHKTGLYRGLLCHNCNVGLGHFQDRIDYLLEAAEYLKQFRVPETNPED